MGTSSAAQLHIQGREEFWRDNDRGGALVRDNPVVLHCYTSSEAIEDQENLRMLKAFCTKMGRETKQGEIGLVIDNQYLAIVDFKQE